MTTDSLNLVEIYENLFAGKKLKLQFASEEELNDFKIRLHQVKLRQEQQMVGVGIMSENERMQLTFERFKVTVQDSEVSGSSIQVTIYFKDKPAKRTYNVEFVD